MIKHYYLCFNDEWKLSLGDVDYLLTESEKITKKQGLAEEALNDDSEETSDNIRNSTVGWLFSEKANNILLPYFEKANELCGWRYDVNRFEPLQVSEYHVGQYYDWHIDGGLDHFSTDLLRDTDLDGLVRKLSLIVQLSDSDDYEGGDLFFSKPPAAGGLDIYGETLPQFREKGSVTVFPSYVRHKVTPVTKGIKKTATFWFCGPPLK